MTRMVGLVACSKSKRGEDNPDETFRAEDLYDSWLFDGRVRTVKAHCDEWGIFSAKHGYLDPDDEISWYDQKITALDKTQRFQLAAQVVDDLPDTDRMIILMGRDYADPLLAMLPDEVDVWDPLEGVQLFDQRHELRRLAERAEVATDGGTDVPILYDGLQRCEECDEIVLIHGRGECLELDEAVYCPRHARPHMSEEDWQLRWGEAFRLLNAIREDPTKAIRYELSGCPSAFWVIHDEGQHYAVWRRCEGDERNRTLFSERRIAQNIERRACFSAYVSDPPHLVSAAHAPINADVPVNGEVIELAY